MNPATNPAAMIPPRLNPSPRMPSPRHARPDRVLQTGPRADGADPMTRPRAHAEGGWFPTVPLPPRMQARPAVPRPDAAARCRQAPEREEDRQGRRAWAPPRLPPGGDQIRLTRTPATEPSRRHGSGHPPNPAQRPTRAGVGWKGCPSRLIGIYRVGRGGGAGGANREAERSAQDALGALQAFAHVPTIGPSDARSTAPSTLNPLLPPPPRAASPNPRDCLGSAQNRPRRPPA